MKSRHWSIRSKIIALITVPLAAFLALWIFATALTAGPAIHLFSARTLVSRISNPGQILVVDLQRERRLSVEFLSSTGAVLPALAQQRSATDQAAAAFRRSADTGEVRDRANETVRLRLDQLFTELDILRDQRVHIDRRQVDAIGAQGLYNAMMDAAFEMFASIATFGDEQINRDIVALTRLGRGQDYLSRVDSLVAGAVVAGKFTDPVRIEMYQDIGVGRFLLSDGVDELPAADRTRFQTLTRGAEFSRLSEMMDTLLAQSRTEALSPVSSVLWHDAYVVTAQQLRDFESDAIDALAARTTPVAIRILARLGLAAVLGLIALIVSVVVSMKVGRSIVGRLRRMRREAQQMSTERLPNVVRRLQRGEPVDVDVETPPLRYGQDEIGQLGRAFNDVQRTAVQSAIEEANVRRGLNEVFLNIARRSQTLLHRQLALLDKMERRESEPAELEDLYRVDHLATRMRRHAEDLVILAGAAPGRGWRNPVPVIDVVRGAISEVEDYKRVDVRSVESTSVLGRAVGDIIHLLAELLENAASFSPPHSRVEVTGHVVSNGYAIEIEDRGLGMTQEAIDEANRRLVEPPEFDPADSARLGLFVVAQLANRHGIRVALRASEFTGVTATVFVPGDLVSGGRAALPAAPDPVWEGPPAGTDDLSPNPLAALLWHGSEELRQVTVFGRPITINGSTGAPMPLQRRQPQLETYDDPVAGQHQAAQAIGPPPSSVADGLSADGLVQRRRVARPIDLATSSPPAIAGPSAIASPPVESPPIEPQSERVTRALPRNSAAAVPTALPSLPADLPSRSTDLPSRNTELPSRRANLPSRNADLGSRNAALAASSPDLPLSTEDGLPRRVRQASLAPQLRRAAGDDPGEDTVAFRSPEQVRSIMSALQHGTTRGRVDASRTEPVGGARRGMDPTGFPRNSGKPGGGPVGGADSASEDRFNAEEPGIGARLTDTTFADAATVSFPAIVRPAVARDETSSGDGSADDRADNLGGNDLTSPDKDAQ
jgi:signal transduction histidine kinase